MPCRPEKRGSIDQWLQRYNGPEERILLVQVSAAKKRQAHMSQEAHSVIGKR
jgi:hypothetical protein